MRRTLASGLPLACFVVVAWGSLAFALQPTPRDQPRQKQLQPRQIKKAEQTEAQPAPAPEQLTPKRDETGPIAVFADLEAGWRNERVQQILRHYGKGKVSISIEGSSPTGGQFSRNQSYYLFQDLFKYTITEKFQFVQYRHVSDGRDKVYAVAEREYRRNDDGRLFKDKIYVSLQLEDDRWVISEVKSTR